MPKYVNVITGEVVHLRYQPAGEAWKPRPDEKLKRRLLREERAVPKKPKKVTA